jgi:zinc finger protein 830
MSDVRALLKAKRQEVKVIHPLATYSSTGQLRCVACGTAIKQASAWDGHVGSKAHRVNVIKMREEEKQKELLVQELTPKRKAPDGDESESEEEDAAKRRKIEEDRAHVQAPSTSGFPANFFSDPSRAPVLAGDGDSDDEEKVAPRAAAPPDPIDMEWEQFQQEMLGGGPAPGSTDSQEAYKRATVTAEAELNDPMEGLPSQLEAVGMSETSAQPLDAGQLLKLKEQEEKELIMDRLLEEERAQEEADAKVTLLKARLEALKRQRQVPLWAKPGAVWVDGINLIH